MGECEKKWRYLRDKYVKERRRLLDETKSTGKEAKSNWPYYESMEFLSSHLRLPCNNGSSNTADRLSLTNGDDEDSLKYSGDSPTTSMVSPQHNPNDSSVKQEMMSQSQQPTEWPTTTTQTDKQPYHSPHTSSELLNNISNSLISPTSYSSALFGRSATPAFTHNPLWAMWANNMQQASQHLNNIRAASSQQLYSSVSTSTPHEMSAEQSAERPEQAEEQRRGKRKRQHSDGQDINIQLSLKDIQPAEKYTEYHFCLSLAQMMENVPPNRRPELKVRLIQSINEAASNHQNTSTVSEEHINV